MSKYFYRSFGDIFDLLEKDLFSGISKLVENDVYPVKFPPVNVIIEEDSLNLVFEFALAGYKQEEIDLTFVDDYLFLSLNPEKSKEEDKKSSFLVNGIKKSSSRSKYFIPFSKYDVDSAKAEFNEGILRVHIPAKEERKPRKLLIP